MQGDCYACTLGDCLAVLGRRELRGLRAWERLGVLCGYGVPQAEEPPMESPQGEGRQDQAALQEPETPDCPVCGGAMVLRTSSRTGNRFWGCRAYPDCRGTRDAG